MHSGINFIIYLNTRIDMLVAQRLVNSFTFINMYMHSKFMFYPSIEFSGIFKNYFLVCI